MIAKFTEEHLPEVLAIEEMSFSTPWTEEMFLVELSAEYSYSWVWLENDVVLGYLICWLEFEDLHIANVAVSPIARGRGIARQLMEYAMRWAVPYEVERSLLEVRVSNIPARNLYASLGFQPIAIRRDYYDDPVEDALILEKRF